MSQWPQRKASAELESNKVAVIIFFHLDRYFSLKSTFPKLADIKSIYYSYGSFILIIMDTEARITESHFLKWENLYFNKYLEHVTLRLGILSQGKRKGLLNA